MPYYFIGYILAVTAGSGINIVGIAIVGAALAWIHVSLMGSRAMQAREA
jgi:mannose/fructose/N-acetylgalactosamine-specific phosphotransferase system component IIC